LTRLSAEHRQVIDLVYYHEKSVDEAAQIIDGPPATVKTRMFYARKKLAQLLKGAKADINVQGTGGRKPCLPNLCCCRDVVDAS
jgi:DNA-directed RNA polymerase specialized sigma24 family protein